jgi:hypothetical protein
MGLGLFGTPLEANIKCIIFSAIILFVYFLPHPQSNCHIFVTCFLLASASYISLAWYDTIYDCNDRLGPTIFGWFSKSLKPNEYAEKFDNLPIKYQKTIRIIDVAVLSVVAAAAIYPFLKKN